MLGNWKNERTTKELCCTVQLAGKVSTHYYPPHFLTDMNSAQKKGVVVPFLCFFFSYIMSQNHTDHCSCKLCSMHILETLWMPLFNQISSTQLRSDPSHEFLYHTTTMCDGLHALPFPFPGWGTGRLVRKFSITINWFFSYKQDSWLKLLLHWSDIISKRCPSSPPFDFAKNCKCSVNWRFSKYFLLIGCLIQKLLHYKQVRSAIKLHTFPTSTTQV